MSLTLNVLFFISDLPNITLQNKYSVGREKSVSLDCKVDGYPSPTITWTPCDAQENVCDQSMLSISNVQIGEVYTCTAKNSLGNDSTNTSLGKLILTCHVSPTPTPQNTHHPFTLKPIKTVSSNSFIVWLSISLWAQLRGLLQQISHTFNTKNVICLPMWFLTYSLFLCDVTEKLST